MTTAPNGELRRQDLHLQVQQLVSLRALPWGGASPLWGPGEPSGAEQYPLHLVRIRAHEFDPRGQAV
jgi:hypothetical protein